MRRDAYGRFFSCLVSCRATATTRASGRRCRKSCSGRSTAPTSSSTSASLSPCWRASLHRLRDAGENPDYDANEIEERLAEGDPLVDGQPLRSLIEHFGEERGTELFRKYRDAFPPGYRDGFLPRTAVADIARIEELESEEDIEMSLYHPLEEPENFLGFKLFRLGEQTSLSGILPLLEDMGVEVVDERPHR